MGWNGGRQWRIQHLRKRDGWRCWLCGEPFAKRGANVTIDHAIPKARGGTNHIANLRLAHAICNYRRQDIARTPPRAVQERLAAIRFSRPVLELTADMRVVAEYEAAA